MLLSGIEAGNSLEVLKTYPDEIFDCCVTSPPYFGLRAYDSPKSTWPDGWIGELGLEPNPELYIKHLVSIFDEVKRTLKVSGSCWVVISDTYGTKSGGMQQLVKLGVENTPQYGQLNYGFQGVPQSLKPKHRNKSLLMIPERFAISMMDNGWCLRNKIIWRKPNAMPSSAKDRFTVDWEYIFFFTKSSKPIYWINNKNGSLTKKRPLGTKGIEGEDWDLSKKGKKKSNWTSRDYYFDTVYEPYTTDVNVDMPKVGGTKKREGHNYTECVWDQERSAYGRIKRTVWDITTKAYHGMHYAVYPPQLVEIALNATCPKQVCSSCGLGSVTRYDEVRIPTRPGKGHKTFKQLNEDKPYTNDEWQLKKPIILRYKSGQDGDPNSDFHNTDLSRERQKIIRIIKSEGGPEYHGASLKDYAMHGAQTPGNAKNSILDSMSKLKTNAGVCVCDCNKPTYPGIVLDPFAGSGTTLLVARDMGRDYYGIEISEEYIKQVEDRLATRSAVKCDIHTKLRRRLHRVKEELSLLSFL